MKINKEIAEQMLENIDDDICTIMDKYIKKGFVSENGELFFEDDELLTEFEYYLGGLQKMIVDTYDMPCSFEADMEAQDEKFGKHKI